MRQPADRLSGPKQRRAILVALLTAAALLLAACGDTDGEATGPGAGDPDGVTSTTLEPPAGGDTIPELPDNDDPSAVQCTGPPREVFDATEIVGEELEAGQEAARARGCDIRVVFEDGEPLAVTQDFRPDRVNVAVEDGVIERIDGLY